LQLNTRHVRVMPIIGTLALTLVGGVFLQAADGVLIVEKSTTGSSTTTNQIQIEKTRMRAETTGQNGEKQVILFDGTKQVLSIVNLDKKTYSEITKEDVDRLSGQMNDAMAMMQAQMANLPPAQRAQMEAMMKGRTGGPAQAPKTEYRKAGTDSVGKWTCDKYEGYQNNQKTVELCTVDPKTLGFGLADFEVSQQLAAFFGKLVPGGSQAMFQIGKLEDQGFSGVPVRRQTLGARPTTSELQDVTHQSFPDAIFAVPPGFEKEASPFGGRGGRGRGRGQN
jgi:hypothetical protein